MTPSHAPASPLKLCECGCGQPAPISVRTHRKYGWKKGEPKRFIKGHSWRGKTGEQAPAFGHTVSTDARARIGAAQRGKKVSLETKMKLSESRTGERNHQWRGDEAGYKALHMWVNRHRPRTGICSECGEVGDTEYANLSGRYLRDLDDYAEKCDSCHRNFDGR